MSVALAASFTPLADTEELEPSIVNEVEHALSLARAALAATNAPPAISTPTPSPTPTPNPTLPSTTTNNSSFIIHNSSFSLSERAIALVSTQKADGRWYDGTNDVTAVVIPILEAMLE